jgi:hypothetical protein
MGGANGIVNTDSGRRLLWLLTLDPQPLPWSPSLSAIMLSVMASAKSW